MSLNISVVIPVYNASLYLRKAVNSALQFDEVKEIILAEDHSTDDSLSVCQQLVSENSKIKLCQHPDKGNHGAGATRNLGIENANSEYIAFLDADDYYLPNRFQAEKEIFKDLKIEGVFGALGVEYLSEKGKEEFQNKFKNSKLTTVNFAAEGESIFKGLLGLTSQVFGTFFHLNTLTIKKSSLIKHHLLFNKDLRVHQDSDFIIKLSYLCHLKSGNIKEAVAIRGVHDNNRITKIKLYSKQYNQRQLLLWKSLFDWSKKQNLPSDVRDRIYLQYKAFELSQKDKFNKALALFKAVLKNPSILKTKYRFTYFTADETS